MSLETILATDLPLWAINLFLAGFIYYRQPHSLSSRVFVLFVLSIVAWSLCVKMVYLYGTLPIGLFWGRLTFAAASLIGCSFAVFCHVFPDLPMLRSAKTTLFLILSGVLVAGLCLTPLVLREVTVPQVGNVRPVYGPLYWMFGIFLLAAFGHGFWALTRKWRAARGRTRQQLQYLGLGLCLALGSGTTTNLIVPALTGSSHLGPYGPYFTLFFLGLTAHAIIRHRLMDIRIVIRQSATYVLSAGAAVGIIWGLLLIIDKGFGVRLHPSSPLLPLMIGVAGAIAFHPMRTGIQHLFDRYCYRQEFDSRQAIRRISQALASLLRIDPLCELLTMFILQTLRVEEVAAYLCDGESMIEQRSQVSHDEQVRPGTVTMLSPSLIALLARARQPILQDELTFWADADELQHLREEFIVLRSKVLIPLSVEHAVAGFIAVGEKRSGDPFFSEDVEFLATIGHQAGAALKRAQLHEEVTWMKEYNESVLRHMESGLVVVSHDNIITVVNEAAARMLGIGVSEIAGQTLDKLIPCGLGLPLLDTLLEKTVYTSHEATLLTGAGQTLPIVLSTSILRGPDGRPGGAILALNDLSQVKALEEEKRRIERLASIGAFMSGIAHEIKNPLVAIKTLAELLPEQYDDEEFRDTFTKVTLSEVDRIDTLLRRLRSLSSGAAVPLQPLNVITPIEETLFLLSAELSRRHIKVVRDYQGPIPSIMGDHDQLKQVFVNLCLNSVEAMGQDGILRMTIAGQGHHSGQPSELIIRIADTGPGIPAEHLATIFDPFFTLKEQGTGLGLAICRGIIDYHRGSISAANSPESCGALFTVKLPVAQGVEGYESLVVGR